MAIGVATRNINDGLTAFVTLLHSPRCSSEPWLLQTPKSEIPEDEDRFDADDAPLLCFLLAAYWLFRSPGISYEPICWAFGVILPIVILGIAVGI